eukprot:CAMPEP_0196720256 /NCGR_PEP_ID=MMETSP1091-20130531/3077_1 /TAXON_ID=302021 /ORGANISM="Rhodomonas sp., Strain CCMP768" /LENGTH=276 /DNA_ID=CAMNT_0042061423 /DNA_START=1 /DNA_END=831 /DNA_ORIENTATION=+
MSKAVIASAAVGGAVAALAARQLITWLQRRIMTGTARQVNPPHPWWEPGQKQPMPYPEKFVEIDPAQQQSCYPLVISAYVPRPIAFVSTLDASGGGNLAPFSYTGVFSHDPPIIAVSIVSSSANADGKKDTLANIDATGEFVVNIMSTWFVEAANYTCANFPRGMNEFDEAGLTRIPSKVVKPPRVKESAVHFECKLVHRKEITNKAGKVTTTVVFGEAVLIHCAEGVVNLNGAGEGKPTVDFGALKPLGRLGGNSYAVVGEIFDLPRPDRNFKKT